MLRGWLDGTEVPAGLTIDTELRWSVLAALVANGRGRAGGDRGGARPGPDRQR